MGTGSFPGVKVRPVRAADHSPPSSAAVMEQYSYTSTHPLGLTGPVTGSLYLYLYQYIFFIITPLSFSYKEKFFRRMLYRNSKHKLYAQ